MKQNAHPHPMMRKGFFLFALLVPFVAVLMAQPAATHAQDGTPTPEVVATAEPAPPAAPEAPAAEERASITQRMTRSARYAGPNSPYYKTTWVTYYGRPGVEVMGILGEYSIPDLIPLLQAQADAYDEANGPDIGVMPAFHLVYGMATKGAGDDGSYLAYMSDATTEEYIQAAADAGYAVILDIQIGNLQPVEALERGLPFLKYPNVQLALDPEFAMSHPDQERPGLPIGFVTTAQINEAQTRMRDYMREEGIMGRRILLVHKFMENMIRDDGTGPLAKIYKIDLTIVADGYGGPWPKIGKYNQFMTPDVKFTGFKLFYKWDDPLMTESQVLGVDRVPDIDYMNVTPNFIIYQ